MLLLKSPKTQALQLLQLQPSFLQLQLLDRIRRYKRKLRRRGYAGSTRKGERTGGEWEENGESRYTALIGLGGIVIDYRIGEAWISWINGILRSKTPALTGVFYCFNRLTNPFNQPSIPGTIANSNTHDFHPTSRLINPQKFKTEQIKPQHSLVLHLPLFPQRNCQNLRSLSPSRMPLARLNLTAT